MQATLPEKVGKYQLIEWLGAGAFAVVYKARQVQTNEIVAVKKMKRLTKQDKEMVKKQIQIMKDLKHKNIVEYKGDFRQNGQWYIVLEYCGKGDMEQFKKKVGKIPEAHCKLFIRGILEALVELHKKKIAHRDLKLANILITDTYQLKLADFGFSKDYEQGYMKSFCGTPLSMAPEILKRQAYNEKCDVWSLGVLMFLMLYNKPPFFPTKTEGMGIPGITNAVLLRTHKFDKNIIVSDSGKKFMDDCLQKSAQKRHSTEELLYHQWFSDLFKNNISKLRQEVLKTSINDKQEAKQQQVDRLCEIMLYGVFEQHLKKIAQVMLLNKGTISKIRNTLIRYYSETNKIIQIYIIMVLKRLQQLGERQIIYVVQDKSYKLNVQNIKQYKKFQKEICDLIQTFKPKENNKEKINIEKQIVKFCINETEYLLDCVDVDQINEKRSLLKNLCKFVTTDYESTLIEIKWGNRKDFEKYSKLVIKYYDNLTEQVLVKAINEEQVSNDDLESTWLIQNHIKECKKNKSLDSQLGKLTLCLLNLNQNFLVGSAQNTQKIQLNEQNWEWMGSLA